MLERSLMTKRYGVPAFSFVTFLPWMVSPIVKPGPTVPLTVFAVAAGLPLAAASAAAATAPTSTDHVRVVLLMSCLHSVPNSRSSSGSGRPMLEGRHRHSHRGHPLEFSISRRDGRPCRRCGARGERRALGPVGARGFELDLNACRAQAADLERTQRRHPCRGERGGLPVGCRVGDRRQGGGRN